jgi:hypothetical protein
MSNKSNGSINKLLNIVKKTTKADPSSFTNIMWGVVTGIEPLEIKVDNRLIITEEFLVLSALCKESIIKIPTESIVEHLHTVPLHTTDVASAGTAHTHQVQPFLTLTAMPEIRLWRGLQIGDNVRLLRINEGQTYFVLEREEGIAWYDTTPITDNT